VSQTALLLMIASVGTLALVALALLAVRVAAFPPAGTSPTVSQRIELYAGAVAMLVALGQAWIVHPGIPSTPSRSNVQIASVR
jgi:hypothetical protein